MGGIFGTKWTNSMGEDPGNYNGQTWRAALKGVTDEQINHGLNIFSDSGAVFIPSATEFKAMCKRGDLSTEQAAFQKMAERQNKERLALPKLKATKETASKHLENMKKLLKS